MRNPNEIEAELDRERAALGGTLHELRETLDLGNFGRRMTDRLALAGDEVVRAASAHARRNPLAVGLTGAGLCLLLAGKLRGGTGDQGPSRGRMSEAEALRGDPHAADRHWTSRARDLAGRPMRAAVGTAQALRERSGEMAGTASEQMSQARDSLAEMGGRARHHARHMADEGAALPGEHPFVAGALAFAVGALAARILPRSRIEADMLEDDAHRLREMGHAAADEARAAVRDAGRAAAQMGEAAVDEMAEIGASAGEAARDRAATAARRVGEAGTEGRDPEDADAQGSADR
ncbi:DUF3618 domain-containing protein [Frigidibacter sp. MR17.24]|uniref:DUF3618 domain-containing protein n=1 Tax=Frigidibacter sp. MR17.24 TaxID=3127345 RepID=UPI003012F9F9